MLNGTAFQATLADDRALEAFVRQSVFGVWHPVGTAHVRCTVIIASPHHEIFGNGASAAHAARALISRPALKPALMLERNLFDRRQLSLRWIKDFDVAYGEL